MFHLNILNKFTLQQLQQDDGGGFLDVDFQLQLPQQHNCKEDLEPHNMPLEPPAAHDVHNIHVIERMPHPPFHHLLHKQCNNHYKLMVQRHFRGVLVW